MKRCLRAGFLCGLLALLGGRPLVAQSPSQYVEGPVASLPDSLREYSDGFTISITRRWSSEVERELVRRAESLYPPESVIEDAVASNLAHYQGVAGSNWRKRFEDARRLEGMRWWWLDSGWVLIPFALTGEAVQHFVERMRDRSHSPPPPPSFDDEEPLHTGSFEYSARVVQDAGAFVVELDALWKYRCGSLCGLSFSARRRVTFDADGQLSSIEGDGPSDYVVR